MSYVELEPNSQEHLQSLASAFFGALTFTLLKALTLFCSGMGSGKSRVMASLPLIMKNSITYVLSPNAQLGRQLMSVFKSFAGPVTLIDGAKKSSEVLIRVALRNRMSVIVFYSCLKKKNEKSMNSTTIAFQASLIAFKDRQQLVLIDEPDLHLTELTGGLNPKVSHHRVNMYSLKSIFEYQGDASMNNFDAIRAANAKCITFSGTANHIVCSKLTSMGYQKDERCVVNVKPIRSLYWDENGIPKLTIIHAEVTKKEGKKTVPNKEVLKSFFTKVESEPGKGLIACSSESQINCVKRAYKEAFGKEISCACITGKSKPSDEEIAEVKYIIGIKLVGTGLDLSTLAEGCEFSHGILLSTLSDKESNPLSKSLGHILRMETSSSFLQLLARLRKGGTFTVPMAFSKVTSLGDALEEIFRIIRDGMDEIDIVGPIRDNQIERNHQGTLSATVQNLKQGIENLDDEERPTVEGVLNDLKKFDDRDLKAEYHDYKGGAAFDHAYWITTVGLLWSVYYDGKDMDHETFEASKDEMIAAAKARGTGLSIRGSGYREGREIDERVKEQVIARAAGICSFCGDPFMANDVVVDGHIDRHSKEGKEIQEKGKFTLDNIVRAHLECDGLYDANHIIRFPDGATYRSRKYRSHLPDEKQWVGISSDNIMKRLQWAMSAMGHTDAGEFRRDLIAKGYTVAT